MINQNTMNMLEAYGFGADVDAFESYVMELQDAAGMGNPEVTDAQYDDYFKLLGQLKPESVALKRNWETTDNELDDNDYYLKQYKMFSINTIMDRSDYDYFKNILGNKGYTLFASSKINGHGIRVVYRKGHLVSGYTRGRLKKGRDITRHVKLLLPNYVEQFSKCDIVEVRGELYCPYENYNKIKNMVKTPLSAVTSLSRDSANDDDIKLLKFCAYQILADELKFERLSDKFDMLKAAGFEVPFNTRMDDVNGNNFDTYVDVTLDTFMNKINSDGLPYDNDGIVVAIDSVEEFNRLGVEGNHMLGNLALKIGHWEQNIYSSKILSVEWCYGKSYITPKAVVEGVITRNGSTVKNVPLYNVGVMQDNLYYPGNTLYFRYGGETGVTLVKTDGSPV